MARINDLNKVNGNTKLEYSNYTSSLANGEELDTGWLNFSTRSRYQISYYTSELGLTLVLESRDDEDQPTLSTPVTFDGLVYLANLPRRQRFMRFRLQNDTGSAISNVSFVIMSYSGATENSSTFPLSVTPSNFSGALLTQSVIRGEDVDGTFRTVALNTGGAILVSDFGTEVAIGKIPNYSINTKFGRNNDIDTGSAPEDVWNGGGSYTGFNCTAAETLSVVSSSANDSGTVLSSGTADTSTSLNLTDATATFVTDGVSAGDIILNDTQDFHGFVSSVDSETSLSVYEWYNSDAFNDYVFADGDSYRVVTAASTGAAVVRLNAALDGDYNSIAEYVVMNGTSTVTTTNTYIRQSRATVELAGSGGVNVGGITARQSTTTANITMVMPATSGQTAICCATIPAGKVWVVKDLIASMVIDGNQSGSAQMQFQVRNRGGAWQTKRFIGISNGQGFSEKIEGGIVIDEQSDVRWRVQSVSTNNTQATALFEYFELNKTAV